MQAVCTLSARWAPQQRSAQPSAQRGATVQRAALQRRQQRAAVAVRAAAEDLPARVDPEDARGAIAIGLKFSDAGNWAQAQEYFERALELPGTGIKRWRDKPPALSTGELTLGDVENGLVALSGAVEQGYRDFRQLRTDPDLEALRADERFEGLLRRYERQVASESKGFFGGLF